MSLVVGRLLLNYIMRPHFLLNNTAYPVFSEGSQTGVLQRVGSAAGMLNCIHLLVHFIQIVKF